MKIIVWLWNPWIEYSQTRHNVGFIFLDYLDNLWKFEKFRDSKFKWVVSEWIVNGEKIILLKPLTFMNLSWESLNAILNFYKLNIEEDVIIIFDDISMDFGKVRYRSSWSAGWHNGIKSIINTFNNTFINSIYE